MDMTVNGDNYVTTTPPMLLGSPPNEFTFSGFGTTTNSTNCSSAACTTDVDGFFAGDDASHAGIGYKTSIPGDYINGAAVFSKD
jgi:hypothetical protein